MTQSIKPGAVIFSYHQARLATFYSALTGMTLQNGDAQHTVLGSETFELVLHAIRGEEEAGGSTAPREDTYVKLIFSVPSLAVAREHAALLGGSVYSASKEWEARGFRACDGTDPDGNVIQFREELSRD